jgi:segregation and condensation protein B
VSVSTRKVVEAILLLADEPVPAQEIGEVLELPTAAAQELLEDLARSYAAEHRGWVLREAGGGWRLTTSPDCAPWLERFVVRQSHGRMSGAALEVLAIVAYRGPLSRAQISEIRGIESDGVVRTLLHRRYIEESRRASGPGSPILLTVSAEFLEKMGLRSVDDLPPLREFMPDAEAVEELEAKLSPNA